jgi:predicted kinase
VYVSGSPGAGKTSLAAPLAAELGYALLAKDLIKETLHDALGAPQPDLAWSRRLGGAAMELLWTLAARSADVLIEANFRPRSEYERSRLTALGGVPVEVHCACAAELAATRYNTRARQPVHHMTHASVEALAGNLYSDIRRKSSPSSPMVHGVADSVRASASQPTR